MINLAKKDIEHSLGKFLSTAMGVGMLLGIVLIMIGVYRGMIQDAKSLLGDLKADIWIVQENTLGPFAESSKVHQSLKDAIKVVSGIDKTAAFTSQSLQLPTKTKPIRVTAIGYDPFGEISAINPNKIIAGHPLGKDHYQIVVTNKTGFKLGDEIKLGRNKFKVVGVTKETVSSSGESLVFISLKDAQELQFLYSNNRIRSDRARGIWVGKSDMVNAIIATVKPGYSVKKITNDIKKFYHKSAYTAKEEETILTKNLIEKSSKQIGLFTIILVTVSTIIIGLIIYTMTLEKMKEIAIMKLLGIPNSMIIKMIIQETMVLGFLAFVFGNMFAHFIYGKFPKKVLLLSSDAWILFVIIMVGAVLASFVGVRKVIKADPASAIGG